MRRKISWYYAARRWRWPLTRPLCRLLKKMGLSPGHITHLRFMLLLFFFPAWVSGRYYTALLILAINFFMDALDGDLARMLNVKSSMGEFKDVMIDNIVVIVLPLSLIWKGQLNGFVGAYYIFCSTIAWWFSMIRINFSRKSDLVINPEESTLLDFARYWVLTLFVIAYVIWGISAFDQIVIFLSVILTISLVYDYCTIINS